ARGTELTLVGPPDGVRLARRLIEQLYGMARAGSPISPEDIGRAAVTLHADSKADLSSVFNDTILVAGRARPIAPKGLAQKRYVDAIRTHDLVFGIGPAGTGKTYLAMALAIRALMEKQVKRIILTRPARHEDRVVEDLLQVDARVAAQRDGRAPDVLGADGRAGARHAVQLLDQTARHGHGVGRTHQGQLVAAGVDLGPRLALHELQVPVPLAGERQRDGVVVEGDALGDVPRRARV
ncbi:MAG: PhoH family protein, partial [Haliangium ochraceum]